MAVITLSVVVPNIDTVLTFFDRIKVYRSVTGSAGPYVEITTAPTRPALVAGQMVYTYADTAGDDAYFYKTSFFHTGTLLESSLSDAQQGEGDPALDVISVEDLKTNYLFGLPLTDEDGNELPDSVYQFYIKAAVSYVEKYLDIPLRPLVVVDERQDYYPQDQRNTIQLQLSNKPIISVERLSLVLPVEQEVIVYDAAWIFPDKPSGQVNIMPGSGAALLGVPSIGYGLLASGNFIPDAFRVNYTAGFVRGQVPPDLVDLVGMVAAMGPLNILGDIVFGVGIQSERVGLDGLMTEARSIGNATNSSFGARLISYRKDIKEKMTELRRYYRGHRFVVA